MNNKPKWDLLAKYVSNECSSTEKIEIETWINANEENEKIYYSVRNIWETPDENFESIRMWMKKKL